MRKNWLAPFPCLLSGMFSQQNAESLSICEYELTHSECYWGKFEWTQKLKSAHKIGNREEERKKRKRDNNRNSKKGDKGRRRNKERENGKIMCNKEKSERYIQ